MSGGTICAKIRPLLPVNAGSAGLAEWRGPAGELGKALRRVHNIMTPTMSSPVLGELQARHVVQKFRQLRGDLDSFASHATLIASSQSFGARLMLEEADKLLKSLIQNRAEFQKTKALSISLSRSLSSHPSAGGGMPPAAKWGNEFRAGSKQFVEGVAKAEKAIQKPYCEAHIRINLPTRTSTGAPEGWFDTFLRLIDALTQVVEYCKRAKK
jgi:hypothetical protein